MESVPATRPSDLPSPRSPTLSEISMILPEGNALRSVSPPTFVEPPPSPPNFYSHSNRSEHTIKLGFAPESRRTSPSQIRSPPLSAQSSRSTLRNMNPSASAAPSPAVAEHDALASSPTVEDGLLSPQPNERNTPSPGKVSNGSSSDDSLDFENMKRWPGFENSAAFDDSAVDLEEADEAHDQFPGGGRGGDEQDNDHWDSDDQYSSDIYSKRAEMILANAKKRLNVMEGNLRGARKSLVVSPTNNGLRSPSELSHQISLGRERDRRLYAGMGPIPPRTRPYYSSLSSSNNSPAHTRGSSETSIPLPFASPTYMNKNLPSKRASSAMGVASAPWSPEGYGTGRFPIRETRSFEAMRDPRGNSGPHHERDQPIRSHSRGSRSPPNVLETLPEDESPTLRRSASTTSSLRDQMNDLKGKISNLKLRAQEDNMRRRSMQSLRTSSPFTSAETWYSGTDAYKNGTSPVAADAGVGVMMESPTRKALFEEEGSDSTLHNTPGVSTINQNKRVDATNLENEVAADDDQDREQSSFHYDNDQLEFPQAVGQTLDQSTNEAEESDNDFVSVYSDDNDLAGSSVYEDAVYEMPPTERHEDRIDAFDYENFFLHSAMGTYSSGRRGSDSGSSSADSVATTRPVTAIFGNDAVVENKRASLHARNSSMDSVSTMASFATAAEDQEEEENERMDQFSQHILQNQHSTSSISTVQNNIIPPRSDSLNKNLKSPGSPPFRDTSSRGSSSPASVVMTAGLQTSKIFSILLEAPRDEPRLALNEEEKQLIYSLSASFQSVSAILQSPSTDPYERKEARRRLDEARRVLNGEEFEGNPF
ncbi:hypothetical protein DM02DRAFT_510061 [Periconia macrospinosa]|uniref:Uncharacterized protein n=1 Tax=Periconia macrospinosa TaxID=97972 RepID=A0A2V1ED86_9PLEO|nr:hypothetical protein DM02DRAFT_510061 [Periconia macrospinosa]